MFQASQVTLSRIFWKIWFYKKSLRLFPNKFLHINFAQSLFVQNLYVFHALLITAKHWPIVLYCISSATELLTYALKNVRYTLYNVRTQISTCWPNYSPLFSTYMSPQIFKFIQLSPLIRFSTSQRAHQTKKSHFMARWSVTRRQLTISATLRRAMKLAPLTGHTLFLQVEWGLEKPTLVA